MAYKLASTEPLFLGVNVYFHRKAAQIPKQERSVAELSSFLTLSSIPSKMEGCLLGWMMDDGGIEACNVLISIANTDLLGKE